MNTREPLSLHFYILSQKMALILNIDTATPAGSVCLSRDGRVIEERINLEQKEQASVIAPYIQEVLRDAGFKGEELDAIAISGGPGSYTGLRVAAATAKGLCYAWDIPMIAISTLKMMANGMRALRSEQLQTPVGERSRTLFCPMIDARRKEVFTALYNVHLEELVAPEAVILEDSFLEEYRDREVLAFGTGAPKAKEILKRRSNWQFEPFTSKAAQLVSLAEQAFREKQFVDAAYFEPFYLKSVYLPQGKVVG